MDSTQDVADLSLLVLSPEYLASDACRHEMDRAVARDLHFQNGSVVPVIRVLCNIPAELRKPIYVDLKNDKQSSQWDLLLNACSARLGTTAPHWLEACSEIVRHLRNEQSVNMVVTGPVKWRPIVKTANEQRSGLFAEVDLDDPATPPRSGLISEILRSWGMPRVVPREPYDLPELKQALAGTPKVAYLALLHFDRVQPRGLFVQNPHSDLNV